MQGISVSWRTWAAAPVLSTVPDPGFRTGTGENPLAIINAQQWCNPAHEGIFEG